jgi:hypothetical protein
MTTAYALLALLAAVCEMALAAAPPSSDGELKNSPSSRPEHPRLPHHAAASRRGRRVETCKDDKEFRDIFGYQCSSWVGYNCRTFYSEQYPYTQEDLHAVRYFCPKSCKLCTVTANANVTDSVSAASLTTCSCNVFLAMLMSALFVAR